MSTFFKSMIAVIALTLSGAAVAHGQRHFHHRPYHGPVYNYGYNWVAPLVIGGAVTYALTRPAPVIVEQPVVVQQVPQTINTIQCSEWREVMQADGTVVKERTCVQK